MKFGKKNGFKIMKKGVDMDHEIYSNNAYVQPHVA